MAKTRSVVRYRTRTVVRRRGGRGRSGGGTRIPLAVVAGFAPLATETIREYNLGSWGGATRWLVYRLSGYDTLYKNWTMSAVIGGWMPILLGFAVHGVANKLGINRAIARAGVPLVSI